MKSMLTVARESFHAAIREQVLAFDNSGVPTNADKDSAISVRVAQHIALQIGADLGRERLAGQTAGNRFEEIVSDFLQNTFLQFGVLRPGQWHVYKVGSRASHKIASFDQYSHLSELSRLAKENPDLAVALGSDYLIAPDIIISRSPEADSRLNQVQNLVDPACGRLTPLRDVNESLPTLHGSVSCKWTLRSDRAQNAKSEALNLVRHRKGKLPHIMAVTGEPLPNRIASLALGTGDLDCVYHFALYELEQAIGQTGDETSRELLQTMITGKRLRDISDLPLDLTL
jgi:hypothetical protein